MAGIMYQTPGGKLIAINFPDDVTDEERERYINAETVAADRRERVAAGADARLASEVEAQGHEPSPWTALASEWGRNFAIDAGANLEGHNVGTRGAYAPESYENPDLAPRDFYERRDAARGAQDQYTEESGLPRWADNTASLAGALTSPGTYLKLLKAGGRLGGAVMRGIQEGTVGGVLEGDATSNAELTGDAAGGAAVGGAVGAGVDVASRVAQSGLQRLFADEYTASRYDAQKDLGMDPTMGSTGNSRAAGIENNRADAFFSPARLGGRFIPDAASKQEAQWKALTQTYNQAMKEVDPNFRPLTRDEFGEMAGGDIDAARVALKDEKALIGDEVERVVPGTTPVNTRLIEEVPDYLRQQGRHGLGSEADSYLGNTLMQNPAKVKDDPLYRAASAKFEELSAQRAALKQSIEGLKANRSELVNNPASNPSAAPRASKTEDEIKRAEAQIKAMDVEIADIQGRIRNNRTRTFGDVKDFRTGVGRKADQGGPTEYVADTFNDAATRSMLDAAPQEFKQLNDKFRENYADDEVIGKYFTGRNSNVFGTMQTAIKGGNVEILDALEKRMKPDDWKSLRAGMIDQMARGGKGDASMLNFSKTYGQLGGPMRAKLVPDPASRAMLDAVSSVVDGMSNQVSNRNFSNTAKNIEASGFMAAVFNNPTAAAKALVGMGIWDAATSSKALAAANAGRPNVLLSALKNGLIKYNSRQSEASGERETMDGYIREPVGDAVEGALQ